jgi:outer membrane lipoprotein LolB
MLHESRFEQLSTLRDWRLEGKLAVNDGKEGGSGKLDWHEQPGGSSLSFRGALGRGAWRLRSNETGAALELADGTTRHADTIEQLVIEYVGWSIPVEHLASWVRGLAAPGQWEMRELDEQGSLRALSQNGWRIEYGSYKEITGIEMPRKLTARRNDYTVKLVISQWQLSPGVPGGE